MLDIMVPIIPLVDALEQLGVSYYIGGSVASSAHGLPRSTIDADIIADLRMEHIQPLVNMLKNRYYIDADMIRDAIRNRSEFNVIHFDTNLKVDIFLQISKSIYFFKRRAPMTERYEIVYSNKLWTKMKTIVCSIWNRPKM